MAADRVRILVARVRPREPLARDTERTGMAGLRGGALFLGLPMARVWAGVDNDAEAETWRRSREETRGALPRKKWFGTEKGARLGR